MDKLQIFVKLFANHTSTDIKLPKTQLSNMIQLAKGVLIPLGLTAVSAADAGIHKKILRSGHNTTLIISIDEMEDILKIVKSLEDSRILLKRVTEIIKDESKEQNGGFLSVLLGTLGASL